MNDPQLASHNLQRAAEAKGADFVFNEEVVAVTRSGERAGGVTLKSGRTIDAPIVVNVATGIATVEPELQDVLRSLGAPKRVILWKVSIPRSLPYLFAALKVAITFAFIGAIVSEIVAANSGIGHLTSVASAELDSALAFAGLLVISAMGVGMYVVMERIERKTTRWSVRGVDVVAG